MINSVYESQIKKIAEKNNSEKYKLLYQICDDVFKENNIIKIDDNIFHPEPKKLAREIVGKIINTENMTLAYSKTLCKGRVYNLYYEAFVVYIFWKIDKSIYKQYIEKKDSLILKPKEYLAIKYQDLYNPAKTEDLYENINMLTNLSSMNTINFEQKNYKMAPMLKNVVYVGYAGFNKFIDFNFEHYIPEIITDDLDATLNQIKFHSNINYNFGSYKTYDIQIFTDFNLSLTEIYDGDKIILYIYNSAEYELIPFFEAGGYRYGTLLVLLRFLLVRCWINKHYFNIKNHKDENNMLLTIHDRLIKNINYDYSVIPLSAKNYYGKNIERRILWSRCPKEKDFKPYLKN